jgi:hypothetical protein
VMAYLWWQHRGLKALDPSAEARVYRKALIEHYDLQIRLLSRVKYWYLLPLYVPMVWQTVEMWRRRPAMALVSLAAATAVFVFIGWLNEIRAVRKLKAARAKVEAMSEEES